MGNIRKQLSRLRDDATQAARLRLVAPLAPEKVLSRVASIREDGPAAVPGITGYRALVEEGVVTLDDPRLCAFLQRQRAVPFDGCSFRREPAFVFAVEDALFDPHSGAVATRDNILLLDSLKNRGRLEKSAVYGSAAGSAQRLSGTYSSIYSALGSNHFHWLIEALPRLYSLVPGGEPLTLLMPDTLRPLARQTLEACLPEGFDLRYVPSEQRLRLERFILPSFLTTLWDFAYPPRPHLDYVRERILASFGLPLAHEPAERIYISRAKAPTRHVTNEEEVVDVLGEAGFQPYILEDLPFEEQVRLFHQAEAVVAPHGAGQTNMLFAGRAPILEITSRVAAPVYFFQSLALSQPYHYLYPVEMRDDPVLATADGRAYSRLRDQDVTVDLDELRAAVGTLLAG